MLSMPSSIPTLICRLKLFAKLRRPLILSLVILALVCPLPTVVGAEYTIAETVDIDTVPSWFRVGFCLLTEGDQQYAAYYNETHQMVVAHRQLDQRQWDKVILPSKTGWDSHNYITMIIDGDGYIHLTGNMHCVPLIYFRTREPGDISTFERLPMTNVEEDRCTYPRFMVDSDEQLLFMYRSGQSGNGRSFFNRYDLASQTWSRFLDTPLFDGQELCNAYPIGPMKGPDGRFHIIWVWRDTPDCATNHDLSYVRSVDLKHWEAADGTPVSLPLTLNQAEVLIDPVPSGGGIINSGIALTFDSDNRPLVTYHKRDANDHMQIYVARPENGVWKTHAITHWDKTIAFGGGGSMPFIGIQASGAQRVAPHTLSVSFRHADYGSGRMLLDEETLQVVDRTVTIEPEYPSELRKPQIEFSGIEVQLARDIGELPDAPVRYLLKWETLGSNRDRPRDPPLPPASMLKLVKLVKTTSE